jgi:hypothetical protein
MDIDMSEEERGAHGDVRGHLLWNYEKASAEA